MPAGNDLEAFASWLPARLGTYRRGTDPPEEFARALRESDFQISGLPEIDGRRYRVSVEGDKGSERSAVCVAHLISPAGYIQNFRTGQRINWKAAGRASALDAQDRAQMAAEAAQKRQERAAERERQCERTAQEVDAIRTTATPTQPYLEDKDVASCRIASSKMLPSEVRCLTKNVTREWAYGHDAFIIREAS